MNVSSLQNYGTNFSIAKLATAVNRSTETLKGTSGQSGTEKRAGRSSQFKSIDGDTAQINFSSLQSFMEKVKTGTVTDADLQEMKDKITQMEQKYGTPPTAGRSSEGADVQGFLEKVKAGTVTDEDLASMKEALGKTETGTGQTLMPGMGGQGIPPMMGGSRPPPPPPPPSTEATSQTGSATSVETTEEDASQLLQDLLEALEEEDSTEESSLDTSTQTQKEDSKNDENKKRLFSASIQTYLAAYANQYAGSGYGVTQDIKV